MELHSRYYVARILVELSLRWYYYYKKLMLQCVSHYAHFIKIPNSQCNDPLIAVRKAC